MHRERVMDVLWPDLGSQAASDNLRGVIHAARRTLEPYPSSASGYLTLQDDQVALCPEEQLWVDVEAFEEAAAAARYAGTAGNYLGGAAFDSSKIIQSGDPVKFNAGELAVQIVRPS